MYTKPSAIWESDQQSFVTVLIECAFFDDEDDVEDTLVIFINLGDWCADDDDYNDANYNQIGLYSIVLLYVDFGYSPKTPVEAKQTVINQRPPYGGRETKSFAVTSLLIGSNYFLRDELFVL